MALKPKEKFLLLAIVLVIAGFVLLMAVATYQIPAPPKKLSKTQSSSSVLVLRHEYIADAHSFAGTLTTPTPCYLVKTNVEVSDQTPEKIKIMLETQATGDVCVQVVSQKSFILVVPASPQAQVESVSLNGEAVRFEIKGN